MNRINAIAIVAGVLAVVGCVNVDKSVNLDFPNLREIGPASTDESAIADGDNPESSRGSVAVTGDDNRAQNASLIVNVENTSDTDSEASGELRGIQAAVTGQGAASTSDDDTNSDNDGAE